MRKLKTLILIICCIVLFSILPASPAFAISIDSFEGTVDSTITVSGLTSGQTYSILWDSVTYSSGVVTSSGIITSTVPEIAGGTHTLQIQSPIGTSVYSTSFSVLPSIEISPDNGNVGTSVSVSGTGFDYSEESIKILYDDSSVNTGIEAESDGTWSASFTIPASTTGDHTIDASGSETTASEVEDQDFTVEPLISISPSSCGVGCTVTVTGSGFTASETSIVVTFDSTSVKTGITADSYGSWTTSFSVPTSYSGSHTISASGSDTDSSDLDSVSFSIVPGISIDKTSAYVGDTINITGTGFNTSETGIYITIDDNKHGSSITADSTGYWETSITVPAIVNGSHTINAYGSTTTASSIENNAIDIQAFIVLSPTGGNVGDTITIKGSGFSGSSAITVAFGTVQTLTDITTDTSGSFSKTFIAPAGAGGDITIIATDSSNISTTSTFAMDGTAPTMPQIRSPEKGDTVGFIGKAKANFEWAAVSDPSGVTYDIQVAADSNFEDIVFEHSDLTVTEYECTEAEALPKGEYYWRVRALDGAANASDWTSPVQFKSGMTTLVALIIILAFLIIVIILILRTRVILSRR